MPPEENTGGFAAAAGRPVQRRWVDPGTRGWVMVSNAYRFVEHWTIPEFSPQEVYAVLSEARLLPEWWKGVYLSTTPLNGRWTPPRVGQRVRATARGFLPYRLHFVLESTVLEPGRVVEVRIQGDLDGTWRAVLSAEARGTRVDIEEQVIATKAVIRVLSPLLKPLFAWNHYWTTPRGEAGLRAYLAAHRGQTGIGAPASTRAGTPGDLRE